MSYEKLLDNSSTTPLSSARRTLADGRYVLVRHVAEGGTAHVWLGYDTWTETWRAVKTLLPEYARRPALRHRFEREAATMKTLSHENIIAVFDAGIEQDLVFMVMEYAEGGSVIDWVERNGPMPPRMATNVVLELCRGIDAAHRQGVIHRDIKPQNLLVDRNGLCKVTDFGIAQVLEETRMTMTGTVMGTMGYMAPEQNESAKHADERADVYSIAATFYTLIKGEAATHLFMAEEQDFDGIPQSLVDIIRRGSQYRREARFSSVREMMAELDGALRLLAPDPLDTPPIVPYDLINVEDMTPPSVDGSAGTGYGSLQAMVHVPAEPEPLRPASLPPPPEEHREWVIGVDDEPSGDPRSLERATTPQIEMDLDQLEHQYPDIRRTPVLPSRHRPANRDARNVVLIVVGTMAVLGLLVLGLSALLAMSEVDGLEAKLDKEHQIIMRGGLEHAREFVVSKCTTLCATGRCPEGCGKFEELIGELGGATERLEQQGLVRRMVGVADEEVVPSCHDLYRAENGLCRDIVGWVERMDRALVEYDDIDTKLNQKHQEFGARVAGCAGLVSR